VDRAANGWILDNDGDCEPKDITPAWHDDVSNVLLGHARVYVFANKYLVPQLQDLALHKLHKFLAGLRIFSRTIDAIFELVEYVYNEEHTEDRGDSVAADALRALVTNFIVMHRGAFSDSSGHRRALKQATEYALDFVDTIEAMREYERECEQQHSAEWDEATEDEGNDPPKYGLATGRLF